MGAAVGDVLGLAAGVAVSPLPIVAMILVLATPQGRANGSLFGLGWLAGLSILGAVVLLLAGSAGASDEGEPAAWTGWLKLLLGVLALLLAARQWRARPAPGAAPEMPRWMAGLDKLKPGGALGLGALLSGVNPKNAALTIAAAATIAGAGLPGGGRQPGARHPESLPGVHELQRRQRRPHGLSLSSPAEPLELTGSGRAQSV